MELNRWIDKLIGFAEERLFLCARNAVYVRNTILSILGADAYETSGARYEGESVTALLNGLTSACKNQGMVLEDEARIQDEVMGALMLSPKDTEELFSSKLLSSSKEATDWFYRYCVDCDYVKKEQLDKNPRFTAQNGLIITINCAKPEFRDPKKAASGNSTKSGYPACSICRDNEGFGGRNKRTLRTVSLNLCGENWFWQYSPYGYFYQHGIAVNERHVPMHVDKNTFYRLMAFVDLFPHYFIGCNAALPRIGGSVLAHDHYQGGGERLPIFDAGDAILLRHPDYPNVKISVLDWFGTAVRVTGTEQDQIAELCDKIRACWQSYENRALGLIPEDKEGVHHAVSPTVVKSEKGYEMTLILRSNITSEQYPDGVFHAHPEFHVIKKESIGLIEAQGLFILPGRLVQELDGLKTALIKGKLPKELSAYQLLFDELNGGADCAAEAERAIAMELASICERILKNTAVFQTYRETADFLKGAGIYEI